MNKNFDYFFEEFGAPIDPVKPAEEIIASYENILPQALLELWREIGWAGYADGLLWVTNPAEFSEVVESWLAGTTLQQKDQYNVIARGAFGDLFLWGTATGATIVINPLYSTVTTSEADKYVLKGDSEIPLVSFFVSKTKEYLDFEDYKDKGLFKRGTKKLGILKSDEMFAFEPALCLGGLPRLENLAKLKMVEHLTLLAQLGEIDFNHIDVSRHL